MAVFIRQPAVAGSFYPKNKEELEETLTLLFHSAKPPSLAEKPRMLIVPHAGVIYSGKVAASGFSLLTGKSYKRVILLGASHHYYFPHAAVDNSQFWLTPLGRVKIDDYFAKKLVKDSSLVIFDQKPHVVEHDLEIEVIFLQKVLSSFQIVPILVSFPSLKTVEELAEKLAQLFDHQTLLVISTDLSHYPPAKIAPTIDKKTIKAILTGKSLDFEKKVKEIEREYSSLIQTAICGFEAVKIALSFGEKLGIEKYQLIDYCHSGEVSFEKQAVVGYAAIVGQKKSLTTSFSFLDEEEKKEALLLVKKTLKDYFAKKPLSQIKIKNKKLLRKEYGVFVTLKKEGKLRGCVGELEGKEHLYQTIQKAAIKSAFSDRRFFPVSLNEIDQLSIEITLLSLLRRIDNWRDIRLGRDGVVIEAFGQKAVFLPQVAEEYDWSLENFLTALCQKAGLAEDCYNYRQTKIYVFQTQVIKEEDEYCSQ